jgi:Ala-tRNA(Pro) deacylase
VYTCEQASRYMHDRPGARTKNLFVRTDTGRYYLIATLESKRVDFNRLGKNLKIGRISFAEPEKMLAYLGVQPGSVTMLALINDTASQVELLVDNDLWIKDCWQCHPLVNTSTLVISCQDMEKFFNLSGHPVTLMDIPFKN